MRRGLVGRKRLVWWLQHREDTMRRRSLICLSAFTAVGLALCSSIAVAQSAKDLVGTWTIVSAEAFGPNPKGVLIFDTNGRYSLMLMRADLPKYASNNRSQGAAEEYKAIGAGSISYFGTYSVSGSELILRIESSSFPNWNGTEQKRTNLTLTGDELKYTNTAPSVSAMFMSICRSSGDLAPRNSAWHSSTCFL
jgi:hypothetical protein